MPVTATNDPGPSSNKTFFLTLEQTLATGKMTYFSRSRNELWIRGQSSGNFQNVIDIRIDCDGDSLLCRVDQQGSACHTNRKSCFYLAANSRNGTVA
jgi:phosphoribosyl-AMP cyclohydrolase